MTARIVGPPPAPAPQAESAVRALFRALQEDLMADGSRAAPALAVLSTFALLCLTLGLYVTLCVAVFAIF
jgi:hypothetical protein